jgi:hypothetical protein
MPNDPLVSVRGERARFPLPVRAAWRYFVTGKQLSGPGDNATLFHHATVDYRARPYIRLTRRRWERLARRHAAITVPTGLLAAAPWAGTLPLLTYEGSLTAAATTYGVIRTRQALVGRGRNRAYIDPAARVLYSITGQRYDRRLGRQHILTTEDWQPGDTVRVILPNDVPLTAAKEKQLVRALGGRLGIAGAKGSWKRDAMKVAVEISGTPLPPDEIDMPALMAAVEAAPLERPVVGWGPDGPVHIDYVQDSPHVALSGAAGTGKTTLLRFLLAQRMRHGVGVIFLDAKRWSHRWAHNLPDDRAQYWYRVPDMHNSLVALGDELQRRINCDESELGTFRTLDVVVEEINSLIKMLTAYWRGERKRIMNEAKACQKEDMDYDEEDLDPPALSPAVAALQFAVNMGRELQIHIHVAAQRLEANVFGSNSGAAVRQSFGLKLMAKWDLNLWKMLASGHEYVAWPGGKRGLWGFVQGSEFVIVRVPDMAMATCLAMATGGQDPSGPVLGRQRVATEFGQSRGQERAAIEGGQRLATILGRLPGQDGPDALSLEGLRSASKRPGFPPAVGQDGVAKLYDVEHVMAWRAESLGL